MKPCRLVGLLAVQVVLYLSRVAARQTIGHLVHEVLQQARARATAPTSTPSGWMPAHPAGHVSASVMACLWLQACLCLSAGCEPTATGVHMPHCCGWARPTVKGWARRARQRPQ